MTPIERDEMTTEELDTVAWGFLRSEFASPIYADWPLDRRLDAYLLHFGPTELRNDGSAYVDLLQHVMGNIGPALRRGVIQRPECAERS